MNLLLFFWFLNFLLLLLSTTSKPFLIDQSNNCSAVEDQIIAPYKISLPFHMFLIYSSSIDAGLIVVFTLTLLFITFPDSPLVRLYFSLSMAELLFKLNFAFSSLYSINNDWYKRKYSSAGISTFNAFLWQLTIFLADVGLVFRNYLTTLVALAEFELVDETIFPSGIQELKNTKLYVISALVASVIFTLPKAFQYTLTTCTETMTLKWFLPSHSSRGYFYKDGFVIYMQEHFITVIPFLMVTICWSFILYKTRREFKNKIIVKVQLGAFCILLVPTIIFRSCEYLKSIPSSYRMVLKLLSMASQTINSTINLVCYILRCFSDFSLPQKNSSGTIFGLYFKYKKLAKKYIKKIF